MDQFTATIGGPLFEILVPLGLVICFWVLKQKTFFTFSLFWLGEVIINISIYIKDAREMLLPVVHGGIHEWNLILGNMQLLPYDLIIGNIVHILGIMICLGGAVTAVYAFLNETKEISKLNPVK
jgi:hypothetical protein